MMQQDTAFDSKHYAEARGRRVAPLPVEPFDKEWGVAVSGNTDDPSPFPRINRILSYTSRSTNGEVFSERALTVTNALRGHISEPRILQEAYAMDAWFRTCPIQIGADELIVGTLGCPNKGGPVHPEFGVDWIVDEMKSGLMDYSEKRTHDYFSFTGECLRDLEGIQDFWRGKTVEDTAVAMLTDEELKGSHLGKKLFSNVNYFTSGPGHCGVNYDFILKKGFRVLREEIEEKLASLDAADPEGFQKRIFYRAALIANRAGSAYIERHAELAGQMAEAETDAARKGELLSIAANCRHIAQEAPRTFWEAIQMVHFANALVLMESNGHSISYGRFDQYMLPFYEADIAAGTARAFMQELIENFMIKIWDMNKLRDHKCVAIFGNGGIGGPCLTIGGVRRDGTDGTNDLTYMFLDAHAHTRIVNPWLAVRVHAETPWPLKVKIANVIRIGTGEPKIFNDDVTIPSMQSVGRELEDCRDYQVVGCVEPDVPGIEYGWKDAGYFNIAKVLELAINDGRCLECGPDCSRWEKCGALGGRLGVRTGSLENFTAFDEVKEAYDRQMEYWCGRMVAVLNALDYAHMQVKPLPFLSTVMADCVEKGRDVSAGGARNNFTGPQAVGIGTVGDGLATIKQLVFDEKMVTGGELLEAARNNWVGAEPLYAYVNSDRVHHYGNDDAYADELARFGLDTYCKHLEGRPTPRGGCYTPGAYSSVANVDLGMSQWASVDGRVAWEPISDCVGAVHTKCCSHDVRGPSAICKSVTRLDHARATNGTLLNWKFSPSALTGETGRDNLISLIEEFVERKGVESQFTVASRETLLKAQAKPEDHRDLLVRIAGYSAYFVELNKELQDDIIGRSELSFD
jgi:formate C-acetyltransferase